MAEATILGISPGTRYLAVAISRRGTLHDFRVRHYKNAWSEEKLIKVTEYIEGLIIRHVITHIACKVPHASRCSEALNELIGRIKELVEEYRLSIQMYSISELKEWCMAGIRNKKNLAGHLANDFPELTQIFMKEMQNRHQYYLKIFEAIAALLKCQQWIQG